MKLAKPKRPAVGDVFSIDLGNGSFAFGRILHHADFAFYDLNSKEVPSINEIVSKEILFIIPVHEIEPNSSGWSVLGNLPLEPDLEILPKYFIHNPLTGQYSISCGYEVVRCSREEVAGLEASAVWAHQHVEDRLRDHFAGVPNVWVELLKPK